MEYWSIGLEPALLTPPLHYSSPDEAIRAHPSTMLRAIGIWVFFSSLLFPNPFRQRQAG